MSLVIFTQCKSHIPRTTSEQSQSIANFNADYQNLLKFLQRVYFLILLDNRTHRQIMFLKEQIKIVSNFSITLQKANFECHITNNQAFLYYIIKSSINQHYLPNEM